MADLMRIGCQPLVEQAFVKGVVMGIIVVVVFVFIASEVGKNKRK